MAWWIAEAEAAVMHDTGFDLEARDGVLTSDVFGLRANRRVRSSDMGRAEASFGGRPWARPCDVRVSVSIPFWAAPIDFGMSFGWVCRMRPCSALVIASCRCLRCWAIATLRAKVVSDWPAG